MIELLVVIAIIAVLAALLLPALSRAKARAQSIKCVSQLKQMGLATEMYASDNNERLPGDQHNLPSWLSSLAAYNGTAIYKCPTEKTRIYTYAVNDLLTPRPAGAPTLNFSKRNSVPSHSETMWMSELVEEIIGQDHFHFADYRNSPEPSNPAGAYSPKGFIGQVDATRHHLSANYLYLDGHVSTLKWAHVPPLLTNSGSRFIMPVGHP